MRCDVGEVSRGRGVRPVGMVIALAFGLAACLAGCSGGADKGDSPGAGKAGKASGGGEKPRFAATIHPLAAILETLVAGRGEVVRILPPGASPHTYDPRPSDARAAQEALALFYVDDTLDGWAARLPARRRIAVFEYVPASHRLPMDDAHMHDHAEAGEKSNHAGHDDSDAVEDHADHDAHDHDAAHDDDTAGDDHAPHYDHAGEWDPHFWMDPLAVKAALPRWADALAELDPEGRAAYEANAGRFGEALDALDRRAAEVLAPVRDAPVVLHHPSVRYLLHRYGLRMFRVIETSPGKEPSPRYLHELISAMESEGVKCVFTEPQLSERPVRAMAEAGALPVRVLDPLGGVEGRESYHALIIYNAETLGEALK